jgi:hypothetical protein
MKKVIGIVGGIVAVAALAFGLYKYVEAGEDAYDDLLSKDDNEANAATATIPPTIPITFFIVLILSC